MRSKFFSDKTGLPFDFVMALPDAIGSHSQFFPESKPTTLTDTLAKGLAARIKRSIAAESSRMGKYSNAIEIGELGHDKDDFTIILSQRNQPWEVFAFGFNLLDNSVSKEERLEVLSSETKIICAHYDIPTGHMAFLGVVAAVPIHSIKFIEDADTDNIAVSDFTFGYLPSIVQHAHKLDYASAARQGAGRPGEGARSWTSPLEGPPQHTWGPPHKLDLHFWGVFLVLLVSCIAVDLVSVYRVHILTHTNA
jgi:hypothetical protein